MYKRILFALDLEGVNNVAGEPYMGLQRDTEQWKIARKQAAAEVNAAAEALFAAGVETVGLWDNHSGGNNVDAAALDRRITLIPYDLALPRMYFADGAYDCICYFGYHAMEGTLGGVLAHTMSSKAVQYYKLNGRYIGEVDMDAYIAASYGIPSRFFAGGDIACAQAARAVPGIVTAVTKKELARNEAVFRKNEELLPDIQKNIVRAVRTDGCPSPMTFPAVMEKSFKRTEDAAKYYCKLRSLGIDAAYPDDEILGKDAHTVAAAVHTIGDFIRCI
ncbi:MAG: M55 family metallopeptidase [Eubacteriales bacterium]